MQNKSGSFEDAIQNRKEKNLTQRFFVISIFLRLNAQGCWHNQELVGKQKDNFDKRRKTFFYYIVPSYQKRKSYKENKIERKKRQIQKQETERRK